MVNVPATIILSDGAGLAGVSGGFEGGVWEAKVVDAVKLIYSVSCTATTEVDVVFPEATPPFWPLFLPIGEYFSQDD